MKAIICEFCGLEFDACEQTRKADLHAERERTKDYPSMGLFVMEAIFGRSPDRCYSIYEILFEEGCIVNSHPDDEDSPDFEMFIQPYAQERVLQLRREFGFLSTDN